REAGFWDCFLITLRLESGVFCSSLSGTTLATSARISWGVRPPRNQKSPPPWWPCDRNSQPISSASNMCLFFRKHGALVGEQSFPFLGRRGGDQLRMKLKHTCANRHALLVELRNPGFELTANDIRPRVECQNIGLKAIADRPE